MNTTPPGDLRRPSKIQGHPHYEPQSRESSPVRRSLARLSAVMAAIVMTLGLAAGANIAHADSVIAGVRFHTTIDCGGSSMLIATNTAVDSGSYNRIAVYNNTTRQWTYEKQWHDASAWSAFRTAEFGFSGRAYYTVYVYYLQSTTKGWMQSGEYLNRFIQHAGNSSTWSSNCLMGN